MQDYLAIIETGQMNPGPAWKALATAIGFAPVFEAAGLIIMSSSDTKYAPLGEAGVAIGEIFSNEDAPRRIDRIDARIADRIMRTNGHALLREYWGGYVAFWRGDDGIRVLRDPSGSQACYFAQNGTTIFAASTLDILLSLGVIDCQIDWLQVAEHLLGGSPMTTSTCVTGVSELLPGYMMLPAYPGICRTEMRWSPWDYCTPIARFPTAEIANELRRIVDRCVQAWAFTFDRVLVLASGGLDSSIVAAALTGSSRDFELLTIATIAPGGDERRYARQLAQHLNVPLHERFYDERHVDAATTEAADIPRPIGALVDQSFQRIQQEVASDRHADAIFSGAGGDNVFCFLHSATPLVDRIYAQGFNAGLWSTLSDICDLTDSSVWAVLRLATEKARGGRRPRPAAREMPFLSCDFLQSIKDVEHPWLDPPPSILPGKAVHVSMLLRAQPALNAVLRGRGPRTLYPLLSQPIIEYCLSIPSWFWCSGGRNRAVARDAYSDVLPASLLSRRRKLGPDSFAVDLLERRRDEIRRHLMNGNLIKQGVINAERIAEALAPGQALKPPDHIRLAMLASTEAWTSSVIDSSERMKRISEAA